MGKSTPATIRATCRDQFEPERCHAQKAGNSAFLAQQPQENLRHHQVMDIKYAIDLPGLAAAIGANPRSLRNAFYLHPDQFPPAIYLPGTRGPRFLVSDVLIWLEARKPQQPASATAATPKPQQGRPRKASAAQIARARQHGQGGAA
ncbi:hypothetical protein A6M27_19230 [Acidithiobacillus thiooxidans]|jgi:hypothetical protein|uniref:Uncharacterized protein n=3 Tax=Acidithiobacillaceae TaxID=225058 RepID=A0A1C2J159_ACITH|nr:hypothetical protein A6P07_03060 [Acidithiobacillus thiooxidans]OCX79115.1 hypothetical protein A6O24_02695 [Acidithiobacillus thiooxidans]OCX81897.1 hypothetical protein A6M27_19230 [Acidithiobacillus thiooxidans]OCX85001.1 hypothetical protein A6O26_02850 [Acidithiobacillus thiooxidans]